MIRPMIRPMLRSMIKWPEENPVSLRYAINFDGMNDYATLSSRAINVNNDIIIEWEQRSVPASGSLSIVTQCDSDNPDARELELKWLSGKLWFEVGGSLLLFGIDNVMSADGLWRITLIGSVVAVYFNGVQVFSINRNRGFTREPSAPTRVAVLSNGGVLTNFFSGIMFNLRINNRLWPMVDFNQAIQPSDPVGNNMTLSGVTEQSWVQISSGS